MLIGGELGWIDKKRKIIHVYKELPEEFPSNIQLIKDITVSSGNSQNKITKIIIKGKRVERKPIKQGFTKYSYILSETGKAYWNEITFFTTENPYEINHIVS